MSEGGGKAPLLFAWTCTQLPCSAQHRDEGLWHGAGVGSTEGSYEYLVFNSTFLGVAKKHGLTPLVDWGDPELDACFEEARALLQCVIYTAAKVENHLHVEGFMVAVRVRYA